jgi:hypothetical protein
MVANELERSYKLSDATGGPAPVVSVAINETAKAIVALLERELGSGPWDDKDITAKLDEVHERTRIHIEGHRSEVQQRVAREEERARLEQLPEEERIIAQHLPTLDTRGLTKTQKVSLAREIQSNEGQVWKLGEFTEWVDPNSLPRPSYLAEIRAKAAERAREAAENKES